MGLYAGGQAIHRVVSTSRAGLPMKVLAWYRIVNSRDARYCTTVSSRYATRKSAFLGTDREN